MKLNLCLLMALIVRSGVAAPEADADFNSRFMINTKDSPIWQVHDTQTSELLGLVRYDKRGMQMYQTHCEDDRFIQFGRGFVETLNLDRDGSESLAEEKPSGLEQKARLVIAGETNSVTLQVLDGGTTCAGELKALVENRGAAHGFRAMAQKQIIAYLESIDRDDVFGISGIGGLIAPYGPDGRFLHPVAIAKVIQGNKKWTPTMKLIINTPGSAHTWFNKELARLMKHEVHGHDGLIEANSYSQVDVHMYSTREINGMASAWYKEKDPEAAFQLSMFYQTQAMNRPDEEEMLLKEARKFTTLEAEVGLAQAMYNAAYWSLYVEPVDLPDAKKWLGKLDETPLATEDAAFAADVKSLQADLVKAETKK